MTKLLIVNADDFGLSPGINYGIIEAHRHGLVTSTTAMMNADGIEHAAAISADFPLLGVGLHFVLSFGAPLSSMPSLEREGMLGKWLWQAAAQGKIQDDELVTELHRQYEGFVRLFDERLRILIAITMRILFPRSGSMLYDLREKPDFRCVSIDSMLFLRKA